MRILLLSFYYPPDIGPGPLRTKSLVDALTQIGGKDLDIHVLTAMPNRYHSLVATAAEFEQHDRVSIQRITLPYHQSGMADQAKAFLAYSRIVLKATQNKQWDIIYATSSRLMTAALGRLIASRCDARLYLDIRDLFTDTIEDVLAKSPLKLFIPLLRLLEHWTFRPAHRINVVSAGFLPYVKKIAPARQPTVYTNGIDDEFVTTDFFSTGNHEKPLVLYAGNIGAGQGLHHVIPTVATALEEHIQFKLIGDGGERKTLQHLIEVGSLSNVQILNPIPRNELFGIYREADVLFLHLNDYKAFRKVLPSKIFEYAATGKPILAGVGGYAADFLREQVPGVDVFEPCDTAAMQAGLQRLLDGPRRIDRTEFCSHYLRKNIMREMAKDILTLA